MFNMRCVFKVSKWFMLKCQHQHRMHWKRANGRTKVRERQAELTLNHLKISWKKFIKCNQHDLKVQNRSLYCNLCSTNTRLPSFAFNFCATTITQMNNNEMLLDDINVWTHSIEINTFNEIKFADFVCTRLFMSIKRTVFTQFSRYSRLRCSLLYFKPSAFITIWGMEKFSCSYVKLKIGSHLQSISEKKFVFVNYLNGLHSTNSLTPWVKILCISSPFFIPMQWLEIIAEEKTFFQQ